MNDPAILRERMVVEQLERRGIANPRVLDAMRAVERDRFIPAEFVEHAYDDAPLPIGSQQTISQPYMVALMCEVAELTGVETVLEIGTGSGYAAAVLARLARIVYTVECVEGLAERARAALDRLEIHNVTVLTRDGSAGLPEHGPYDAILVAAAAPDIPRPLLEQLGPEGRLVIPVGEDELQTLVRIRRVEGRWREEYFGECRFVPMTGKHGFGIVKPDRDETD